MTAVKNLTERSAIVSLLFLILFCTIPSAHALNVVPDNPLSRTLTEGETVEFTLSIYGHPYGDNYSISLETDLEQCGSSPIYDFKGFSEEYIKGDRYKQDIRILAPSTGIRVHIKGVTPSSVKIEDPYKNIKIITYDDGPFTYYDIRALDSSGQEIQSEIRKDTFYVAITELEEFQDKMKNLASKGEGFTHLKTFVAKLDKNGLKVEANELADLLLKLPTSECKVNYFIFAAIIIVGLLITGWVGHKIGYDAGYDEGYDECIATKSDDEGD